MISSSLSSARVISLPPGWPFPQQHPPHLGSQAAPMLSYLHQSRNSRLVAAVTFTSAISSFCNCAGLFVGSFISSYLTAAVLMERAKCVLDLCAATSISSNSLGCAPPTVFPSGLSHKTRSATTFTLCGASLPSLWLMRSSTSSGLFYSSGLTSGKNLCSFSGLMTLCTLAISSRP